MRRSASTKRRSSLTGVRAPRRDAEIDVRRVVAREMVLDAHRVPAPRGRRRARRAPRPRSGRCRPVATSTVMRSRGMPPASMPSISGRRNRRLGTGRVMSQIRMQALLASAHERRVRRRADRPRERIAHRGVRVGELAQRRACRSRVARASRGSGRAIPTCRRGLRPLRAVIVFAPSLRFAVPPRGRRLRCSDEFTPARGRRRGSA